MALHEVSDGTFVVSGLEESYEYKGLELSDADGVAAQNDSEAGVYEIALKDSERLVAVLVADGEEENEAPEGFDEYGEAAEALNNNVDISEDAGSELSDESPLNDDASTDVEVHITPAMLTVRYVNDSDAVASDQKSITVLAKKQSELNESDSSSFHLVLDDNAVLSTNGREELGMVGNDVASDSSAPALLTDELLLADDGSSREPIMQRKAEEYLDGEGVSTAGRSWDFQYLDLVNANDGNVWIASSAGADVYWPYPKGTDKETEFTLVHYGDLYREYGINGAEDIEAAVENAELDIVDVECTDYGIKFHVETGGYGPFALSWKPIKNPTTLIRRSPR